MPFVFGPTSAVAVSSCLSLIGALFILLSTARSACRRNLAAPSHSRRRTDANPREFLVVQLVLSDLGEFYTGLKLEVGAHGPFSW